MSNRVFPQFARSHFRLDRPRQKLPFLAFAILPFNIYTVVDYIVRPIIHTSESSRFSLDAMELVINNVGLSVVVNMLTLVWSLMIFVYGALADCLESLLGALRNLSKKETFPENLLTVISSYLLPRRIPMRKRPPLMAKYTMVMPIRR